MSLYTGSPRRESRPSAAFSVRSSTLDMSRSRGEGRVYSSRYVEFLEQYTRRYKRPVAGPPEGYQASGAINGVQVGRKGRGAAAPKCDPEASAPFRVAPRRLVPRALKSTEHLLQLERPFTADQLASPLKLVETASRTVRRHTGRHNVSSMQGGGVHVTEEPKQKRAVRGRGSASPGFTSPLMTSSLSWWNEAGEQLQEQASSSKLHSPLWAAALARPATADSILRHRYSDPDSPARPARFEAPARPAPSVQQRRDVFVSSFQDYAVNRLKAEMGAARCKGLATSQA